MYKTCIWRFSKVQSEWFMRLFSQIRTTSPRFRHAMNVQSRGDCEKEAATLLDRTGLSEHQASVELQLMQ